MAFTLYDAAVRTYLQVLGATRAVLDKGRAFAEETGLDLNEVLEKRLAPDMLTFKLQIILLGVHSAQALDAVRAGAVKMGPPGQDYDYAGLQQLLAETESAVRAWTPEAVNALVGKEVVLTLGQNQLPFTAEDYLMSFALPNFYFHATTAYDILRQLGAPIGKRDFLGQMRMKTPA
jgi:hypothetical protein